MNDLWEASLSLAIEKRHVEKINLQSPPGSPPSKIVEYRAHWQALRRRMFLPCWYLAEHESAAMWGLYEGREGQGIALSVNIRATRACPTQRMAVQYSRGHSELYRLFIRRYSTWKRVLPLPVISERALSTRGSCARSLLTRKTIVVRTGFSFRSISRPWSKRVYVAPTALPWFADLVERTMHHFGGTAPAISSNLLAGPVLDSGS
jgi:hypothetical protein